MTSALDLFSRGEGLVATNRLSAAVPLFVRARSLTRDPFLTAELFFAESEARRALGEYALALQGYWAAHRLYRQLRVIPDRLETLLGASACLRVLSHYPEARRLWENVERMNYFGERGPLLGAVTLERALVDRGAARFDSARVHLKKLLKSPGTRSDRVLTQNAWWALGGVERFSGRFPAAIAAFVKARGWAQKNKDLSATAFALCGEAGMRRVLGQDQLSHDLYKQAHGLLTKLRDPFGRAYGLCGMANALRAYGDPFPTLALYKKSAALYRRLGDTSSEGFALWGLGGSFRRLKKFSNSEQAYNKAMTLFRKSGDDRGIVMTHLGRSLLASDLGRAATALSHARRADRFAREHALAYEGALARWFLSDGNAKILRPFGLTPTILRRWKDIP